MIAMRLSLFALLLSLLMLVLSGTAGAQTTATVAIEPEGVVIEGGRSTLVFVVVQCTLAPGDELLEGLATVSQEQASGFGSLNPRCDGKPHRNVVRVRPDAGLFQPGEAFASAFLLFLDPETGTTVTAQDARTITLRGSAK
jgi:hypothetical protein